MDFEKQTREMISGYVQHQHYLWSHWELMMQGWIDTFYRSAEAWNKIQRPDTRAPAPLGLRQLDVLEDPSPPVLDTQKIEGTVA